MASGRVSNIFKRVRQDIVNTPAAFEISKSSGVENGTVILPCFVEGVFKSPTGAQGYDKIRAIPIMPSLINNSPLASATEDGRTITFRDGIHEYRMDLDCIHNISINSSGLYSDTTGWFVIKGLGFSRTVKNGVAYQNLTASSIEEWADGPNFAHMYSVLSQVFDPEHVALRSIPNGFLPVVTVEKTEEEEGVVLTDEEKKKKRKDDKDARGKLFNWALQEKMAEIAKEDTPLNRYLLSLFDTYRKADDPKKATDKRARAPQCQIFVPLSLEAHQLAEQYDAEGGHSVIVDAYPTTWAESIYVHDKDGKPVEVTSSTEPIKTQILAKGVVSVVRVDDGKVEVIRLELAAWNDVVLQAFGITHPPTAEALIPRLLPITNMVVSGRISPSYTAKMEVNAQETTTSEGIPISGLSLDVRAIYLDYAHLFNHNCQRVDADTALDLFYHFIASFKASKLTEGTTNPEWILRAPGMSVDVRNTWNHYLTKATVHDRMGFETVVNLTGRSSNFYFSERDKYFFYVMMNHAGVLPEYTELMQEHADFKNDKHLGAVSKEVSAFVKSNGRAAMFAPPAGAVVFQIFAVNREFMNTIAKPFKIKQRKSSATGLGAACSGVSELIRTGSDLTMTDDELPPVTNNKEPTPEKKPTEKRQRKK